MLKLSKLEKFILRSKSIHGDKYSYINTVYINSSTKVNIYCNTCEKEFFQLPSNHAYGKGCYNCSNNKRMSDDEYIKKYKEFHGNKYKYDKFKYINANTKVQIYCNSCQKYFFQLPYEHLKYGCNKCAIKYRGDLRKNKDDNCIFVGKRESYIKKHKTVKLYFLEFKSEDEIFYKIGITSLDIEKRFASKAFKKYSISEVKIITDNTEKMILIEDEIISKFSEFRYLPKNHFSGHTECFYEKDKILKYIEENI